MRKLFLCTLMVLSVVHFCFGQVTNNTDKLLVQTYGTDGLLEQFQLNGREALSFDIPLFIKENAHLERVIINGSIIKDLSTTIIKYDSNKQEKRHVDYICKDVKSDFTPLLGVLASGKMDLNGVNIKRIIPTTSAAIAGIKLSESILEYNGDVINSVCDLKTAVKASNIGERVELKLENGRSPYSKYVVVGSRESKTITYNHCEEEPFEIPELGNQNISSEEFSLSTYPNPTTSISHVVFTSASDEDVIFSVQNITGQLIHQSVITEFSGQLDLDYDLSNESDGTYIISIQQGKEVYNHIVQLTK